jgi:hypothetical protein
MARWRWLLSAALAASAISSVATVQAEEESENENGGAVSIDEIPAPARDAILRHVGSGMLMEVVQETGESGQPVYKGRIRDGERVILVWVDAAGNVVDIHRIG